MRRVGRYLDIRVEQQESSEEGRSGMTGVSTGFAGIEKFTNIENSSPNLFILE
jgi:hypothetical protein